MSGSNGIKIMKKICKNCKQMTEWSYTGSFNEACCGSCGGNEFVTGHGRRFKKDE